MTLPASRRKLSAVGNYRLTGNTLGRGNFARVEEAVHTLLHVKVAVKVMDINQIKEDYVIKNLCREAKIMSKLNHPCIVALFQTMQRSDNVYYLVTELVSGGDLCSFVKSQHYGKLEERPTRIYARQFASALSHMHGLGIVHRDLKMENVMLNSSQSQIKIVDFGLSNLWSPDNPLRTHCGSPEYAAPELFITGKQYGAEVDLWSLGIILYGMVLGQLPFVTVRGSTATSQERRKKLVAQINRGLSTHHRRALAPFSPEFRGLMSRLLVSDAAKRITVKELTAHAWITERGRRLVRSWPLKEVDGNWRNKMIFEIASLLQIEKKLVLSALSQDPLGKIGGMYNILQRRYQMSQLHGDGVTRSVPSVTLLELSDMTKGVGKERAILSSRSPAQKKPQTAAVGRRTDYYCTPRMVDLNKHLRQVISSPNENVMRNKLSQTKPRKKEPQPQPQLLPPKQRPCTVQPTPSTAAPEKRRPLPDCRLLPDYRTIQSPNLRRKAYSATVTPKTNRPFSPPPTREGKRSLEAERARVEAGRARVEAGDGPRRGGEAGGGRSVATQHCCSDEQQRRFIRAIPEQTRCRSEQSHHRKRPVTGPLQQFFERSLKTAGVTVSRSVSKTTEKHRQGNAKSTQIRKREDSCWEACGGDSTRAVTAVPYPPGRKPAIYDPIARSIADYVVNNVPHKLPSVPWMRKMN